MANCVFQDPSWYRATTLAERSASPKARVGFGQSGKTDAERRMSQWRSQPPFTTSAVLAQRLAIDGITQDEFLGVLGEPLDCISARLIGQAPWLETLSQAFENHSSAQAAHFSERLREQLLFGLLNSVGQLVGHSLARLHKGLDEILRIRSALPVDRQIVEQVFLPDLLQQLLAMVSRTLVLELNVARVEGLLEGDTPEERFRSFVKRLHDPEIALALMHEYPVLARQLTIRLDQWVACTLEFIVRLCTDWDLIRRTLSPDIDPGTLTCVQNGAGDRHRSGRSVLIAKFGSGFQLVYKPKSMAVDVHFQELLTWMNQRGSHPTFRTLQILDRGPYGWSEFVNAESCDSLPALRRFYERQGAYLALLYVLEATDFHCENLIASGEHPVLIDLEAIFQPRCPVPRIDGEAERTAIAHSVLRVGILPLRWSSEESDDFDLSGLGGAAGQMTPFTVPDWESPATDEMRLTRKRIPIAGGRNRPSLNGAEANAGDYVEEIATGFTAVYRLLLDHVDQLLAEHGPLTRFGNDEVRAVLRATRTYNVLLVESFHPDVLRDALDRDLLLDRLWVAVESRPYLAKVISAEREDLQRGDIPFFSACPSRRDVWTSTNTRLENFFDESAMTVVERRLRQLSERDLDLQRWMIRASLATNGSSADGQQRRNRNLTPSRRAVEHDELLTAAQIVGDRIESTALRGNGGASWIGLALINENQWSISPLMLDLYGGLPGVALFLAYLGAVSGEWRYTELAQRATVTMLRHSEECKSFVTSIGAFTGWGGMIYALTHLATLWNDEQLLANTKAIVELLLPLIEQDEHFDIIAGAAGCIGSLIALYHRAQSRTVLSAAIECGNHLVGHGQPTSRGIGWTIPKQNTPLSGFAHGAAGIAWALLKLASLTGSGSFHSAALAAIDHERSLFSPQAGNWRDLRVKTKSNSQLESDGYFLAWCNGAPGIGAARLSTLQQLDDDEVRQEIAISLNTTLNDGFGHNHSLCHGDLGNLDLLLQAGLILDDGRARDEAYRRASTVVDAIGKHEFLCGTPSSVESPGLMTGLAGIGYGLLRLAEPTRVPSLLMLEPPPL